MEAGWQVEITGRTLEKKILETVGSGKEHLTVEDKSKNITELQSIRENWRGKPNGNQGIWQWNRVG